MGGGRVRGIDLDVAAASSDVPVSCSCRLGDISLTAFKPEAHDGVRVPGLSARLGPGWHLADAVRRMRLQSRNL